MNVYPLKCRIRAEAGVTRVDVYDDIGGGGWFSDGVSAADFAAQLAGVTGRLEVHINSGGGDVFDGISIGNAIRGHRGPVTTVVDGLAASIASVIAQAGNERVAEPGSMMMIHDAFGMCVGNADEARQFADLLDKVSDNIADIYASRAGKTAAAWRDAMRTETWYTAEEAVEAGLADRVGEHGAELPAGLDVAAYTMPGRIAAALRSLPRAAVSHAPFDGDHSHDHPAFGGPDADGDGSHGHKHTHSGDADHDHDHDGVTGHLSEQQIRALVRDEVHISNANVDESAWDGNAAMSGCSSAADFRAICAGEHTAGDPDERQHWALPHHKSPGAAPNRNGVNNAMSRLPQTQDLKNHDAAEAHLKAHQSAMGSGSGDHAHPGFAWSPDQFRAALERTDK